MAYHPSGENMRPHSDGIGVASPCSFFHASSSWVARIVELFADLSHERIYFIFHDDLGEQVGGLRYDGDVGSAAFDISAVLRSAIVRDAKSLLIAHNHPHGRAVPSRQDIYVTRNIAQACRLVGMRLSDHLVVAGRDVFSFHDHGLL